MAGEPPGREKSGLYPGDRVEQANRLQVVEINGKLCYNKKNIFKEEIIMKTVKLLFFSVVFTLAFCFAAFASEKKIPATENFTNDVVYDNPRNLENADANNLAAFLPQIEKFCRK